MNEIPFIIIENDPEKLESFRELVLRTKKFRQIGFATGFAASQELVKIKGRAARVAFLDGRLEDDTDKWDISGQIIALALRDINPEIIIASISSGEFEGANLQRVNFDTTKAFLQAVIGLANQ